MLATVILMMDKIVTQIKDKVVIQKHNICVQCQMRLVLKMFHIAFQMII